MANVWTNDKYLHDEGYYRALSNLKSDKIGIGFDTITLHGFYSRQQLQDRGFTIKQEWGSGKVKYDYIQLPHGGRIRFSFTTTSYEDVNRRTGEVISRPLFHCTVQFSVGSLLFNDNSYLGDGFLLEKCYDLIHFVLGVNVEGWYVRRVDISADYALDYDPLAISKYVSLPVRWKKMEVIKSKKDGKRTVYLCCSETLVKSQKLICIYSKGQMRRIELRLMHKGKKYNKTSFYGEVMRMGMKVEPKAADLTEWHFFDRAIKYYLKHIEQMISPKKLDKRFNKSKIFKCRDKVHSETYRLWKTTQTRLSMGSLDVINANEEYNNKKGV